MFFLYLICLEFLSERDVESYQIFCQYVCFEMIIWLFFFILLVWYITFIYLYKLNYPCILWNEFCLIGVNHLLNVPLGFI